MYYFISRYKVELALTSNFHTKVILFSSLKCAKIRVKLQMASVEELQILLSRVQFPLDSYENTINLLLAVR